MSKKKKVFSSLTSDLVPGYQAFVTFMNAQPRGERVPRGKVVQLFVPVEKRAKGGTTVTAVLNKWVNRARMTGDILYLVTDGTGLYRALTAEDMVVRSDSLRSRAEAIIRTADALDEQLEAGVKKGDFIVSAGFLNKEAREAQKKRVEEDSFDFSDDEDEDDESR